MKIILSSITLIAALMIVIWKISSDKAPSDPSEQTVKSTSKSDRTNDKPHDSAENKKETSTNRDNESQLPQDPAAKDAIIEKIHDAATTYKAENLSIIKPYLLSPDPEIRQEAVRGMSILGEAAASPMLREAAKQMNTAEDVKIMLEAAEYLELPRANLKELLNKKKNKATPPPAAPDPSQIK